MYHTFDIFAIANKLHEQAEMTNASVTVSAISSFPILSEVRFKLFQSRRRRKSLKIRPQALNVYKECVKAGAVVEVVCYKMYAKAE